MNRTAGEECYDTSQCYYSLICLDNVCKCYNGFKPEGNFDCIFREVGDSCSGLEDCQQSLNTICTRGACGCASGFKAVTYLHNVTKHHRRACIAVNERLASEGEPCSVSEENPLYCEVPNTCTFCGDRYVCARPPFLESVLAGSSSSLKFSLIVFIISIICISLST